MKIKLQADSTLESRGRDPKDASALFIKTIFYEFVRCIEPTFDLQTDLNDANRMVRRTH